MKYTDSARFGKNGIPYGRYCGECIYFLAGAGCRRLGLSFVRFDCYLAKGCPEFVDVDTVME